MSMERKCSDCVGWWDNAHCPHDFYRADCPDFVDRVAYYTQDAKELPPPPAEIIDWF